MRTLMTLGLIASACTSGCLIVAKHEISAPPQTVYVPARPTTCEAIPAADLKARYEAAMAITDFTIRDQALSQVAPQAAACGDMQLTRAALGAISDFTVRDSAADAAAMVLAQIGMRTQAIEIARTMSDFTRRDATLQKLSTR